MAQALHAVPPVPAAPAEVLEAHLGGAEKNREKPGLCQHQPGGQLHELPALPKSKWGIPDGLCGVRRDGPGDPSHPQQRPDQTMANPLPVSMGAQT